jgi:hypothetical protein
MTGREFLRIPGMPYALVALGVAAAVVGWTAFSAYRMEAALPDAPPQIVAMSTLDGGPPPPVVDVGEVVSRNAFSPDRTAPPKRYLLPGEEDPDVKAAPAPVREPPRPIVLGTTVVLPDSMRSTAIARLGTGAPVVLRIGGKIGEFTLVGVAPRKAIFTTAAGQLIEVWALRM